MADVNARIGIDIDASDALAQLKALQRQLSQFHTSIARSSDAAAAAQRSVQKNLIDSVNSLGGFSAELRTVRTTAESFTNSLEKNKFSMREYFRYAAASTKTFGSVFRSEFDTIGKVAEDRVKKLQTQYIKMGRDANGAMRAIAIIPDALNLDDNATRLQLSAQRQQIFNQLVKQGSTNLLNFGKNTQWAGRQLMVGFTIPLMTLGSVASRTFMEMETAALKFRKVYGDLFTPKAETQAALEGITELGRAYTKYGISVAQTVGLAAEAAAAGFQGVDLQRQTEQATRLSILGQIDQQKALETTITLQNAFRLSSEELADSINFLNAVENQTVTSLDDVTTAIPKAAPVIQQLGGDVRDLAFLLTAMREGGINASEGANALKSGLASIINPTAKASEMLASMGINIDKIVESNRGNLRATVVEFATAMNQLDPLSRARAIEQLFGKFQFARISTLLQNVTQAGNQADRVLSLASSSVQELADLSAQELGMTAESAMNKFKGAVENLRFSLIPLGETFLTVLTPIVEMVTSLLDKFNNLGDGTKKVIAGIALVLGGIGPIALMTFGLLANGLANIIKSGAFLRNTYLRLTGQSKILGDTTQYLTSEQIEASAAAASLDQAHANLTQRFTVEATAVDRLRGAYLRAISASQLFATANPGMMIPGRLQRFAQGGIIKGPGTGTSDSIIAKVSNGEAIIPAKSVAKNPELVSALVSGNIPGFNDGLDPNDPLLSGLGQENIDFVSRIGEKARPGSRIAVEKIVAIELGKALTRSGPEVAAQFRSYFMGMIDEMENVTRKGFYDLLISNRDLVNQYSSQKFQQERPQFAHIGAGRKMTAAELAQSGAITSQSTSRRLTQFTDAIGDDFMVDLKTGFAADLLGSINNDLAKEGANIADVISDSVTRGTEKWRKSIEIGGGNFEDLVRETTAFDSRFTQNLQNARNSGIQILVDTEADIQRLAEKAQREGTSFDRRTITSLERITAQTVDDVLQIGSGLHNVFQTAENTITEIRAYGLTDQQIQDLRDAGVGNVNRGKTRITPGGTTYGRRFEGVGRFGSLFENSIFRSLGRGAGTNSPSEITEQTGIDIDKGLVNGMERGLPQVMAAAQTVGRSAVDEVERSAFPPRGRGSSRPAGPSPYMTIPGFGTSVRIPENATMLPLVSAAEIQRKEREKDAEMLRRTAKETEAYGREIGKSRRVFAGLSPNITNVSFGLSALSGMLMMSTKDSNSALGKFNDMVFKASTALMSLSMISNMIPTGAILGRFKRARESAAMATYGAANAVALGGFKTMRGAGIAARVAGAGSGLPGILGKVVPLFGRLAVGVSKFLGPWGMAIAGVSAAVGIWKAVNAAKEKERRATEGLADAMTITAERAKNLGEFFGVTPQALPAAMSRLGIGSGEQLTRRQQILESDFFKRDYVESGTVQALRGATAGQASTVLKSIITMMRGQGFTDEMIQEFVDALKAASGKTDLSIDVKSVTFENLEASLSGTFKRIKDVIGNGMIGKQLEKELKTAGRFIGNTFAGLAGQLNSGKVSADQFKSSMSILNVEFTKLDATSKRIMLLEMFKNLDKDVSTAISKVGNLNRQLLLTQAAMLGVDITEMITGNKASNKTIQAAIDKQVAILSKVGKAVAAAAAGTTTPTTTPGSAGEKELSALQKAVIARYEKEVKALEKKRNALKEVNDELDRQYEFEKRQQELTKSMVEAKITGDYIGAALASQQKLLEKTQFDRETRQIELDKKIEDLRSRIAEIEAGGKVTAAEAALAGKVADGTKAIKRVVKTKKEEDVAEQKQKPKERKVPESPYIGPRADAGGAGGSSMTPSLPVPNPSKDYKQVNKQLVSTLMGKPKSDIKVGDTFTHNGKTFKVMRIGTGAYQDYAYIKDISVAASGTSTGSKMANGGLIKVKKYSMGGLIKGPGTSKSDSILGFSDGGPIRLSNNEYVMQAAAVRANGLDYMNAMNSGKIVPGASSNSTTVYNSYQIDVSGVQDPERAADLVMKKLQVASNKTNRTNSVSNNRRAI